MKKRNIDPRKVVETVEEADVRAIDALTGHFVAVKQNRRWFVVIYDVHGTKLDVVTVYQVSRKAQIENRLRTGRWVEI